MSSSLPSNPSNPQFVAILEDIHNFSSHSTLKGAKEISEKVNAYISKNVNFEEVKILKKELDHEVEEIKAQLRGENTKAYDCLNELALKIDELVENEYYVNLFKKNFEEFKSEITKVKDNDLLVKIIKKCAKIKPDPIIFFFEDLGIDPENQEGVIEIAKECAKHLKQGGLVEFGEFFKVFQIDPKNQDAIIEIVNERLNCLESKDMYTFISYFENFKIDTRNSNAIVKIVKKCLEINALAVFEQFQQFGISPKNQKAITEIVNESIEYYFTDFIRFSKDFALYFESQDSIAKLAKKCMTKRPLLTLNYIEKFGLDPKKNQAVLIELAEIGIEKKPSIIAEGFEKLGIDPKNQPVLINLAKKCAKKSGSAVATHFENFGIDPENQKAIIEIVKECAKHPSSSVASFYIDFGIDPENQEAVIEIVKECAKHPSSEVARFFISFGIDPENQKVIIEIIKECSKHPKNEVALFFKDFGIDPKNQKVIIEIAKECSKTDSENVVHYFKNFGIDPKNQEVIIEIAKECAKDFKNNVALYFKNFGIDPENQKAIIEIARECSKRSSLNVSTFFENFGIDPKNQEVIIEIVKKCATNENDVATNFSSYKIDPQNQKAIIEIAKECARTDGENAIKYFENFGISSPNKEIYYQMVVDYIRYGNYNLMGFSVKLANLNEPQKLKHLYYLLLCMEGKNLGADILDSAEIQNTSFILSKFQGFRQSEDVRSDLLVCFAILTNNVHGGVHEWLFSSNFFDRLTGLLVKYPVLGEKLPPFDEETVFSDFHEMRRACLTFILLAYLNGGFKETDTDLKKLKTPLKKGEVQPAFINHYIQTIFSKIIKYRNAGFALTILQEIFSGFLTKSAPNLVKAVHKKATLAFPCLFAALWASDSKMGEYDDLLKEMVPWGKVFKDSLNGLEDAWLKGCIALQGSLYFSSEQKILLLLKLIKGVNSKNHIELIKRLNVFRAILSYNITDHSSFLKILEKKESEVSAFLTEYLKKCLKEDSSLNLSKIENLGQKYLNTLCKMRVFGAWKIYGAALMRLKSESVLKSYNELIVSILDSKFDKVRYEDLGKEKTPHIHMLSEECSDVWKAWQKKDSGEVFDLTDPIGSSKEIDFLKVAQSTLKDGHFNSAEGREYFETFIQFLENPSNIKEILSQLDDSHPKDIIQKQLIQLCIGEVDEEDLIKTLTEIIEGLKGLSNVEFVNDLRSLIKNLSQGQQIKRVLVKTTDDWMDLFLCGTEVAGSCQRVDGDPELNQGLLGYLLDGKNKMIAILDPKEGTVLSRSIFRLLWDKENEKPALFLDRIYPYPVPQEYIDLIIDYAKKEAKRLNVSLYIARTFDGFELSIDELSALGGRAPFEYSDQARGPSPNGIYTVRNVFKWTES